MRFFTTYLEQPYDAAPRQTDCPGGFLSAQPMRTLLPNPMKNYRILLLILGILNPIKLTWGVHVSHTKFKIMVWVLYPPQAPHKVKVADVDAIFALNIGG